MQRNTIMVLLTLSLFASNLNASPLFSSCLSDARKCTTHQSEKDVDTGGRPTPLEDPIRLKSVINNVGFEINGKNLLDLPKRVQINIPF